MTSEFRNGGPAFPFAREEGDGSFVECDGMSLRDYFAAHAPQPPAWWLDCYLRKQDLAADADTYAQWSITYADGMLKARKS